LYGHPVQIVEDETHEFKAFSGGKEETLIEYINKYLCGFVNHRGGTLYLGITDDGYVDGSFYNRKEEDFIRLTVDNTVKYFNPPLLSQQYIVLTRQIIDPSSGKTIPDRAVYEIKVDPGDTEELCFA
jgi:predicted HTH transcriptional regulator